MASLDKVIEFFFLIKKPTTARSVKYGAAMRRAEGRPCLYVHHFMKNSGQTVGASSISAAQEFISCLSRGVLGLSCHGRSQTSNDDIHVVDINSSDMSRTLL